MQDPLSKPERGEVGRKAKLAVLAALRMRGGQAERRDVVPWALAHGGFTQRELAEPPGANWQTPYESYVHGRIGWAFSDLKNNLLIEKLGAGRWRLTPAGAALVTELPGAPEMSSVPSRSEHLAQMDYLSYMKTPEWRRTRAAALARADHRCQVCNAAERLDVHHRTYERRGSERPADLIVLCRDCHSGFHAAGRLAAGDSDYRVPTVSVPPPTSPAPPDPMPAQTTPGTQTGLLSRLRRALSAN